jgi:hypothetical protein
MIMSQEPISIDKLIAHRRKLSQFLSQLQRQLPLSNEELCNILQITEAKLKGVLSEDKGLNSLEFLHLANKFKFSLDAFHLDQIDLAAICSHYKNRDTAAIPARYEHGALSKIRAIRNIMSYVQAHYGPSLAQDVFFYFNFSKNAWINPDRPINIYFVEDVLSYLRSRGLNDLDFIKIGEQTVQHAKRSSFGQLMSQYKTPSSLFEGYVYDHIQLIENNNAYRITRLNHTSCTIETLEIPDVLDTFKKKNVGGPERCIYRTGVISAATQFSHLPQVKVIQTECVHQGGRTCKYEVDYPWASFQSRHSQSFWANYEHIN